jgi:hypothetical protein
VEHSDRIGTYCKESSRGPENPPAPLPSVTATRKAITDRVVRSAIAVYHQAERAKAEAEASFGEDPQLDPVMCIVVDRFLDAQRTLIRAILGVGQEGKGIYRTEKKLWPACGVECDGRLYLVAPDPGMASGMRIGEAAEHNENVMVLSVIDQGDVEDVGTLADDPVYHPDGSRVWHIDDPGIDFEGDRGEAKVPERIPEASEAEADEPAPPPRRQPVDLEPPPLALVRTTMTINSASEPGYLTSIDVVVYDQQLEGQAGSMVAEGRSIAEIRQAGWHFHALGPMTIGFRTVS